jgi:hypothetical protein
MSKFANKTSSSSLQRKNLLQARLFDDEVQQEIFPVENKKNVANEVSMQYNSDNNDIYRDQRSALDELNAAIGDLSSWQDARMNTDTSSSTNEFNFNALESDEDDVSAKLSAFIEEELSHGTDGSNDSNRALGGIDQKGESSKERLKTLIKEGGNRTKAVEIVDLSSLLLQDHQMAQLKSSHLGANFQGEKELEATKGDLLAQLEADDAAFEEIQAQLNASSWDEDLERLLDEPRK